MPERLRQLHSRVIAHDEIFPPDTTDEEWLRAAGEARWIVFMKEDRIRYRAGERQVILETGVACFCLHPSKGMTGDDMAEALAIALPRVLEIVATNPEGGYIKAINRIGQVRHLFP